MEKMLGGFAPSRFLVSLIAGVLLFSLACSAGEQQKKKGDGADNAVQQTPLLAGSVSDQIDHDIGEMLGAFQVGDVEAMHKYYADNATFVSGGSFEPPVVGWKNYVALYEREKAAFQGMQLIRRNTFVFVHQDVSWVSYQWQFDAMFNGKPFTARGQTTLVLNKVGDNWLIVHNHTSEICPGAASSATQQQGPMQTPTQTPATPTGRP